MPRVCSWLMTKLGNWPVATGLSLLISKGIACASPFLRLHQGSGVENPSTVFCSSQLLPLDTRQWVEWFSCPGRVWSCILPKGHPTDVHQSLGCFPALLLFSLCLQGTGDSHAWMAVRSERSRWRASSGEAQTHHEVISECFGRKSSPSGVLPNLESSSTIISFPFSRKAPAEIRARTDGALQEGTGQVHLSACSWVGR